MYMFDIYELHILMYSYRFPIAAITSKKIRVTGVECIYKYIYVYTYIHPNPNVCIYIYMNPHIYSYIFI
jgi:hypothetical protein